MISDDEPSTWHCLGVILLKIKCMVILIFLMDNIFLFCLNCFFWSLNLLFLFFLLLNVNTHYINLIFVMLAQIFLILKNNSLKKFNYTKWIFKIMHKASKRINFFVDYSIICSYILSKIYKIGMFLFILLSFS